MIDQKSPAYKIARHLAGLISALVELIPELRSDIIKELKK